MLKEERMSAILNLVNQKGTITVNEIVKRMDVSKMTVRRDLGELEELGELRRIHGGAKTIDNYRGRELSHVQKQIINRHEKQEIAEKALQLVEENDTIFLGAGTTIEIFAQLLDQPGIRVVTASLPVFTYLSQKEGIKVYLIGGEMRTKTQAFYGEMAQQLLESLEFGKTFISCNAFDDEKMMTSTLEEGKIHQIALDHAKEKYLLIDSSKYEAKDFCTFYQTKEMDAIIMNEDEFGTFRKVEKANRVIV